MNPRIDPVAHQMSRYDVVCDAAEMNAVDCALLWRRQFLNQFAFEGSRTDERELDHRRFVLYAARHLGEDGGGSR
jgi:hypothetical protein